MLVLIKLDEREQIWRIEKVVIAIAQFFQQSLQILRGFKCFSQGVKRFVTVRTSFFNSFFLSSHCTKKWSFLLRISSVNVTISAVFCRFDHIYYENPSWKSPSLCSVPEKQFIINSSLGRLSWKTVAKDIFRAHWNIFDG